MAATEADLMEAAVETGLLSAPQLDDIRREARKRRLALSEAVVKLGRVPSGALYQALAQRRRMAFLQPSQLVPEPADLDRLPQGFVIRQQCLPIRDPRGALLVAVSNPDNQALTERVGQALGESASAALAHPQALAGAVARAAGEAALASSAADVDPQVLMHEIVLDAVLGKASDIHLEPNETHMRVRLRIDGRLQDWRRDLSPGERDGLVNRIKALAQLDIAESRAPQDGSLLYGIDDLDMDRLELRISTLPVRWGERVTLRLLGQIGHTLSLGALGFPPTIYRGFSEAIQKPHGVILVTGPTGSGKSTTLYSALREIDRASLNVMTVEDPIEEVIDRTAQVQVSVKVSFAQALRAFLRQDPDVLLVGEIRDHETASIALRAAQTGHLVLSTLHTNTAIGAITRLTDLGLNRAQIGSALEGMMAQRLVRRLCPHCAATRAATVAEKRMLGCAPEAEIRLGVPVGCPHCLGSGYRGRVGVFEAIWCDDALRALIADGASEAALLAAVPSRQPLEVDLRAKVLDRTTSIEEAVRLGLGRGQTEAV
ncbi:MAG: ATPase, T2SS/T4P/T4SS family [Pseudomonadota bacterium]